MIDSRASSDKNPTIIISFEWCIRSLLSLQLDRRGSASATPRRIDTVQFYTKNNPSSTTKNLKSGQSSKPGSRQMDIYEMDTIPAKDGRERTPRLKNTIAPPPPRSLTPPIYYYPTLSKQASLDPVGTPSPTYHTEEMYLHGGGLGATSFHPPLLYTGGGVEGIDRRRAITGSTNNIINNRISPILSEHTIARNSNTHHTKRLQSQG